jgi:hypothetical protein
MRLNLQCVSVYVCIIPLCQSISVLAPEQAYVCIVPVSAYACVSPCCLPVLIG